MSKSVPELVNEFVGGDQFAFEELIRRFRKRIYSLAYHMLGNHLDADEVVQESFVRIYRRRKELADVSYFSTFLTRIATNYAIDLLRKRKHQLGVAEDTSELPGQVQLDLSKKITTPSQDLEKKRIIKEIFRAMNRLPAKQRVTVMLHDIQGYSKAEIARIFECPEATVRSNLHIARTKLRKALKQKLKTDE